MAIEKKKFQLTVYPSDRDGTIAELTETGYCDMTTADIATLTAGKGSPDQRFSVDAGILGAFTQCRKIDLRWERASMLAGVRKDKYTLTYRVDGTDFGSVLNSS